ncbi:GLPGLI family protein [Sphingobacterium olei]|uniref:GLPGLI family protein n=1 Tax=Sphingobacterium olei TaxID=2571155 RepID=A0A4U0N8G3_9SPHI|nr:GLPGLI family protein [Sphingobacterium olei]TJZ50050.1 GLPGLI family protein [Sphingobacterium olei]
MKTYIILASISLCLASYSIAEAQSLNQLHFHEKIVYTMQFVPDSNNMAKRLSVDMELLLNSDVALFSSVLMGVRDTLELGLINGISSGPLDPDGPYWDNKKTNEGNIRYTLYKFRDSILIKDNYTHNFNQPSNVKFYSEKVKLDWVLATDTMTIQGFQCQKAYTQFAGRGWTVWFTLDIPIEEGPYKFRGLPGLILNAASDDGTWQFDFKSFNKIQVSRYIYTEDEIKKRWTSKEKFFKDKRHYLENATVMDLLSHQIFIFDDKIKKDEIAKDKLRSKADNNWIELAY